ncbi:hypothetical protein BGZ98_005360, partial [Dissophora globulifera]
KSIFVRVPASGLVEHVVEGPSWDIEQTVQIVEWVHKDGVDLINASTRGNTAQRVIEAFLGNQVPYVEEIKEAVPSLNIMTVGLMLTGKQGEEMLQTEKAGLIAVERSFLRHQNCVGDAVRDLNVK